MRKMINFRHVNAHGDFAAVLAHYQLEHARKGDQLRMRCPFHDDKTPSLSITLTETTDALANSFHCFGCHKAGSIIDFVTELEGNGDLRAAAEFIAGVSGCALAPPKAGGGKPGKGRKSPGAARTASTAENTGDQTEKCEMGRSGASQAVSGGLKPLKFTLTLDPEHPYLLERVDPVTCAEFELGHLTASSKSMMTDRVCIPIHDHTGALVAYAGRYASDDVPDDADKYLFPPQFSKSSVLFNAHRVGQTEDIVIVEGFFAAMRLHMLGAPVVALMGTAVSEAHVQVLRELGVRRVLVVFDNDEPGNKALPAALSLLTRSFFVSTRLLAEGCDPEDVPEDDLHELAAVF